MPSRANIAAYHANFSPCANSTSPICYNTAVSGQNIITSLWFNTAVGALCYLLFVYFRAHFRNYDVRVHARSISLRPPALDLRGARRFYSWLVPALRIKDEDLVKSAGLDALVAVRALGFGLMLLVPVCVVCIGVVLPVNYLGDYFGRGVAEADASAAGSPPPSFDPDSLSTTFVKLTMSNVAPGSKLMWVHFVMVIVCVLWGCWLITEYYKEYISLRQAYMIQATEVSLAQGVTQQPLQGWADGKGHDLVGGKGPEEMPEEPGAAGLASEAASRSPKFRPRFAVLSTPVSPFAPLAQGAQLSGRLRAVGEDEVLSQASLPAFEAVVASPVGSPPADPLQRQPTPFVPVQRQPTPFPAPFSAPFSAPFPAPLVASRARAPGPSSPLAPSAQRHAGSSAVVTALGGAENAADA
ncbi:late exocytosis protein, partial [Helicosporidium sp. ATCC 50920]